MAVKPLRYDENMISVCSLTCAIHLQQSFFCHEMLVVLRICYLGEKILECAYLQ